MVSWINCKLCQGLTVSLNYMREGVNILGSKYSVNGNLCDNPPKFQFRVNGQASSFEDALHKIFKIDVAQHYEKLKDERALLQKWSRRGHQQKSSNRTILGADYRLKSSLGSLQSMGGTQLGSTFSNPVYNWKQPYSEFEAEEAKNDVDDNAVIEYTIGEEEGQAEEIIENQVSTPFDAHSILSNLKVPRSMWADTLISANLIWHLANYIPNTREVQQLNPLEERNARPPASGRQSLNNISVFTPQWQELTEGYMRSIMYSLLELTSVNPYLYAKLQELDVLTKTEINELELERNPSAKRLMLLNLISGKEGGFECLMESLHTTQQSGALDRMSELYEQLMILGKWIPLEINV